MKHIKKFEDYIASQNPAADSQAEPKEKSPEAANTESPAEDSASDSEAEPETAKTSETPAEDAAEEVEDKEDESLEEGNAFCKVLAKAKSEGLEEFEFNGKTYKVEESANESQRVSRFGEFLHENFALYPSYNNMLGSEVMRNVPITHQVNLSVYGKENVIDQEPVQTAQVAEVTEGSDEKSVTEAVSRFKTQKEAMDAAEKESKGGYAVHVNKVEGRNEFELSDWYEEGVTIASYENGKKL
jgi:hypothetical protein